MTLGALALGHLVENVREDGLKGMLLLFSNIGVDFFFEINDM